MAKERSPNRKKAFKLWCDSGRTLKPSEIAKKLNVSASLVRKWKSIDEWECRSDPHPGAPLGNKNALGNKGGGAPHRNKNAVTHGLYETIWMDALEPDEQIKLMAVETDPRKQIENTIRLLELRERRMLLRIKKITDGWDDPDIVSTSQLVNEEETDFTFIDQDGHVSHMTVKQPKFKEVQRTTKTSNQLDRLLAIEEALTRVQDKKAKYIDLLNKLDMRLLSDEEQRLRIAKMREEVKIMTEKAW